MLNNRPKVSIIVLNWNAKDMLKNCLESIFEFTEYTNYNIIVVDNGSIDGSQDIVRKKFPQVDLLALDKNYGFPGGNNRGMKYALKKYKPKYFVLISNDMKIIEKDWLTKMVEFAETDENIAVLGPRLMTINNQIQTNAAVSFLLRRKYYLGNKPKEVKWIGGVGILIRSSVTKKIGFFDERYNTGYYEDIEFCLRCNKNGYKVIMFPKSKLFHIGAATWDKMPIHKIYLYYRNRTLYFITYFPQYLLPIILDDMKIFIFKKDFFILLKAYFDAIKLSMIKPLIF